MAYPFRRKIEMKNLYKGYIETINCIATRGYKQGENLLSLRAAEKRDEYAGLLEDNVVLITVKDFAFGAILDCILHKFKIRNSSVRIFDSEWNFLFYNNGVFKREATQQKCALGFPIDIKLGSKDSYVLLKYYDNYVYDNKNIYDDADEVPQFLKLVDSDINLLGLKNKKEKKVALQKYCVTLISAGFDVESCKKILKIINDFIFENPLKKSDFNEIIKDENFNKSIGINRKFSHSVIGDQLINEYHIKKKNNQLFLYTGEYYQANTSVLDHNLIKSIVCKRYPNSKDSDRKEVYLYINDILQNEDYHVDTNYIGFKNGILRLSDLQLQAFTPDLFIENIIPHDYAKTESELMDKAINLWCDNDSERIAVLEEMIGICMYSSSEVQKMFILKGPKNNGKSTFLKVLTKLLGDENVSSLSLAEMEEKFSVQALQSKLANIGDDISDKRLNEDCVSKIKKIVTGERIKAEHKGVDLFFFVPKATLVFSTNNMPVIHDPTGAMARRLILIPFEHDFSVDSERIPGFEKLLFSEECIERLIYRGIIGLNRVRMNNGEMTESESCNKLLDSEIYRLSSIKKFIDDTNPEESILYCHPADVYSEYTQMCFDLDIKPASQSNFVKEVKKQLNLSTQSRNNAAGVPQRVFIPAKQT